MTPCLACASEAKRRYKTQSNALDMYSTGKGKADSSSKNSDTAVGQCEVSRAQSAVLAMVSVKGIITELPWPGRVVGSLELL